MEDLAGGGAAVVLTAGIGVAFLAGGRGVDFLAVGGAGAVLEDDALLGPLTVSAFARLGAGSEVAASAGRLFLLASLDRRGSSPDDSPSAGFAAEAREFVELIDNPRPGCGREFSRRLIDVLIFFLTFNLTTRRPAAASSESS